MKIIKSKLLLIGLLSLGILGFNPQPVSATDLTDAELELIVRQSYQYVAMYNVNNNFAMVESNPLGSKGWNKTKFNLELADHTVKAIARVNNDTYYIISMLDLRDDAVVINYPAFDTKYASLEVSGYDHYVTIPIATSKGDFKEETTLLYYSDRTKNYNGEAIKGVDKTLKMTSDYVIAFLRVSPHVSKDGRNVKALDNFKLTTLAEFQGKDPVPQTTVDFPAYGNDQMVFKNNFLETMQFVFNHISLDPENEMDKAILGSMKKLGVEPGKEFDPAKVAEVDGKRVAEVAKKVYDEALATWNSPDGNPYLFEVFLPKGEMNFEAMVTQSAVGPIGLPVSQAVYPGIGTASGEPMNAMNDYVIKMTSDELPPADAFWSFTLYDTENGFLIPNDRFKYIVGENGGMQLNADGGIEVYIAAKKPAGVPEDNWLPINREDIDLDILLRMYAPRVDELKNYSTPKAELVTNLRRFVPTTVSEGWQDVYKRLPDPTEMGTLPGSDNLEAWGKVHSATEEAQESNIQDIIKSYALNVELMDFGGVPVLDIKPNGWKNNGKVLVYVHGGAYTMFSAISSLGSSGPVVARTGLRVIAVDYTNPPRAKWQEITDQVLTVFKELMKQGYKMKDIAIYGDSAGGGLAAGSVLKMRDAGLGTPAAVVLWSPWADITETGDTYQTLKDAEPNFLYDKVLGPSADAYADREDQKHPYVSPVYGDFTKGFPPTLIQGGTREIFLSNFIRLYQALDTSGQTVKLDIYEGMPHVFQLKLPKSPESVIALKKMDAFLVKHLKK